MTKRKDSDLVFKVDNMECPFREFKDNELSPDYWGLGPAACRAAIHGGKISKPPAEHVWVDKQAQPLPKSMRHCLHGWVRAEELASERWEAEVMIFEESNESTKMSMLEMQLSHAQVLTRSSFCRKVLSACFMLEGTEDLTVQHQWENFVATYGPEGWRARYHIYSPGMKSGGGLQHRPSLSKNGCYLVRLFYLGAWRCVWVNDLVPVDGMDAPLLPFSPLLTRNQPVKPGGKSSEAITCSDVVYLWPMLICKALLKLAVPNMKAKEENTGVVEDEVMPEFDIMHALTGCMSVNYVMHDKEELWKRMLIEVPVFNWDNDEDTTVTALKNRTKKPTAKEAKFKSEPYQNSLTTITIHDTKNSPPYLLPGITPACEMSLIVMMARDLPLKQPLPEPEVEPWKYYRWVDWARAHGLYDEYYCPRTRFLKVNGLMKLFYAPHLVDVMSTESITFGFRQQHDKSVLPPIIPKMAPPPEQVLLTKEELRDWVQFEAVFKLLKQTNIIYFPSLFEFTSATSSPFVRVTKVPLPAALDILAPKCAPLYLQIDGSETICLRISLAMLHPRVMTNCGIPQMDYVQPAYLFLEKFEWFVDCEIPIAKAFMQTRGYDSVEVKFQPGRHYCRYNFKLWVHSHLNWHVMMLSESRLRLGTRDVIQSAAVRECPWASKFLNNLSEAFSSWIRVNRSNVNILAFDRDFFKSYQPDLVWDRQTVGYNQALLHWMFRQALQSLLRKRLQSHDYRNVCTVFRHFFCDPVFGMLPKPPPPKSLRDIVDKDPCDCYMPEAEQMEELEECLEEEISTQESRVVDPALMTKLLSVPTAPAVSQVCELTTDELPCGFLKIEREKVIMRHEAATFIQAHWRGTWARKCLNEKVEIKPEILKLMMENAFGVLDSLSALMNEFFGMYPGAKTAYSVASALSGVNGLLQYHGSSNVTARCKWIPYFQGVFHCHAPVKVHFDIQSTPQNSVVMVYNNDNGLQMSQTYNTHHTFDLVPNNYGYTVIGHGNLSQPKGVDSEAQWQLTVLSSIDDAFHVCDNDPDGCHKQPVQDAYKLHIDELFLPNRRKILGGLLFSVTKTEAISFRAVTTSPELKIVATLRTTSLRGNIEELAHCSGKGEINWPFIQLRPSPPPSLIGNIHEVSPTVKPSGKHLISKNKGIAKGKETEMPIETKQYSIEVTAPEGWPLTLGQWKRVAEVRNSVELITVETHKKPAEHSGKGDKEKEAPAHFYKPQPDDAYIELECSLVVGGGTHARRDDLRDQEFTAASISWDASEPGRNLKGAQIREEFRAEFLVPPQPSESESLVEEAVREEMEEGSQQGPTPATESGVLEMSAESEEEVKYLLMPEQLKDKFVPLEFVPLCMKEKIEENTALLSDDMAEAAKQDRHARIEAALERMKELQRFNENLMLGRQKRRCQLLEDLAVDAQWCQELTDVLEERDSAIAREILAQTVLAAKKKQEELLTKKGK